MVGLMLKRLLISLVLGIAIAIAINEFTFFYLKSAAGRGPERIELVISAGAAARIAKGEPNPSIPANMTFVAGDTLVVKNMDVVTHRLGPLLIPAGASSSLVLKDANSYAYTCSFQPSNVFGLNVQEPVTSSTRLYGILLSGLPLAVMFAIYSVVIWPLKPANKVLV